MTLIERNNVNIVGSGTTIVYAHGFGCDQNMWRFLTPTLGRPYRNVLYDLVGSGKSHLAAYERQVAHLIHLVDDLLDVARFNTGKITLQRSRVDLLGVIASAVEVTMPMIEAAQHELKLSLPPAPVVVDGDATRLVQVVANLVNNAAKYTPPGGRLEIGLGCEGATAVLRVVDNGVGLSPEALSRVFGIFVQEEASLHRAQGGLGIGLSLVQRLVDLHGGTVTAGSAGPGRGCTFELCLGLAEPAVH